MIKSHTTVLGFSLFTAGALCLATIASAEDDEKPVSIDQIPAGAATALKTAAGGAAITRVTTEDEDGKTEYEATFTVAGHKHEVAVTAEGTVTSKEEEVSLSDAPAAVKAAIETQAGGKKLEKVERAEEKGKVTYEAKVGKKEYKFAEDGKVMEKEDGEKEGKEDKD